MKDIHILHFSFITGTDQFERNNSKPEIAVCPYNMESVRCERQLNKIEIQSVEVMQYSSFCKKRKLDQQCTECIQKNVQKSCSFNNTCQPIIWTKSVLHGMIAFEYQSL